jgi:peptidoglycan-N-acetylglucosamine deacetylase
MSEGYWHPDDDDWRMQRRDDERHRRAARRRIVILLAIIVAVGVAAVAVVVLSISADDGASGGSASKGSSGSGAADTVTTKAKPKPVLSPREKADRADRLAVKKLQERSWFITRAGHHRKYVALTFDDGPGPYTEQVLKILRRKHVPATFFVVGQMISDFSHELKDEIRDGFVIGDHTENHKNLATLSRAGQLEQIVTPEQWLHKYHAPAPLLFRAPYGAWNSTTRSLMRKKHLLAVFWTVDAEDWRQPGTQTIISNVLGAAKPGAIILMHDAGGTRTQTVAALPTIIDRLRAKGYELVTVPRLIRKSPPRRHDKQPLGLAGGGG